jgi:hypothetical protein
MKKLFYFLLLLGSTYVFAQNKGMTYQAVIYAPGGQNVPGVNVANVPMTNRTICLQFSLLDANSGLEYQEVVKTKTDEFGMVNIAIGSGTQTGGYATSFASVVWSASADKSMKVALDATGLCNQYEELSVEKLDAVPFANAAITAGNVTGVVALANGGTGATTAAGARTNLGIGNVDNTSDLNKPMSTATKTYVDSQLTNSTIVDADANTKGKVQLAGDLAGTAAAPTVPGLALKENAANKSTTTTLGTSNVLFPTQNAVKTYVDTAIAGATIVDADANTKGKIQLAGDLSGTAAAPTVPGLALKLDASLAGVPNGIATLNSAGIIPANQLPPISVASTNVVGSQAAMLALSNATVGSIAVRTDVNKNFILSTVGPSVLANWIELLTPGAPVQSVNGLTGAIQLSKSDINLANVDNTSDAAKPISTATQNALNLKLNTNQVGVPNGTASLNALGKIPTEQIPAISFSSVKVLGSQAEMLAQTNALIGSVIIRTDVNKNYVLAQSDPTILANWVELLTPAPPVQSVNGYVGNVSLTKADLGLGNVDNTGDINKPVSTATQTALDLKANLASPSFTGTVSGITKSMVGLANVDNTTDLNKPVSTATQTALDLKANTVDLTAETTRATAEEATLTTNVATNATAIAAETTRATAAEALKANATDVTTSLALKEDVSNKSTTPTLGTSDTLYPSQNAVKTYVDTSIAGATIVDANGSTKGKLKLAGDLAGTADLPEIATGAVTSTKILDGTIAVADIANDAVETTKIKDANVTYAKIQNVSATNKVLGRVSTGAGVIEEIATTGSGNVVRASSPTLITPDLGTPSAVVLTNATDLPLTTGVIGILPEANGGTGSATKNFVDLTTNQTIAGSKSFDSDITANGVTVGKGSGNGDSNVAVGTNLGTGTGYRNTGVGAGALQNFSGTSFGNNTGVGYANMQGLTTGYGNTSLGGETLASVATSDNNTAIGNQTLRNTVSSNNTALGASAGNGVTSGANNTFLGSQADTNSGTISNATAIGQGAIVSASNTVQIGNSSVTSVKTDGVLTSNGYIKTGGTASQFLKADGSVDSNGYLFGTVPLTNGGTGATTAAAALTNLGAEPTANKSTATDLGNSAPSDVLFPSQKAVKAYVDTQTAAAGVSDGSITSAKIADGTIVNADIATNAAIAYSKLNLASSIVVGDLAVDAVETAKVKDANITYAKIQNVATGKVLGRVSANAGVVEEIATTGTGDVVRATSPTLVTPVLGAATGTSLSVSGQLTSTVATGTAPFVVTSTTPVANLSIGGNAATVTTNANLTGDVTSSGNATTIGANKVVTGMIANATITNAKLDKANIPLSGFGAAAADVALGANKLTGVADPTLAQDAATKNYVDTATAGITTLAEGKIYLGNASNVATEVTPTGDVTMTNAGVTAIGTGKVVVGMLATDAVETLKIKDANVTTAKLADAAVTTAKITDANVTTAKLADTAVTTAKITDSNVTYAKIQNVSATDKVLGRVTAGAGVVEEIATTGSGNVVRATSPTLVTPVIGAATGTSLSVSGQLTSTVATGTAPLVVNSTTPVANLSIGGNAATVTTNANLTGDVTSVGNATTIGASKVVTGMIADGTIAVADLADDAVETAKIKNAAVTTTKITDANVTYAKIQNVSATDKVLGRVSAGAGAVEEIATTGSGNVVRATSPTLVTPTLGAATATTINKVTITQPTTSATLTIADGKTLTANNSIVLAGTDATTMTFPTTDATIARTDAAQTFTGVQTFSSDMVVNSVNIGRGKGAIATNTAVGTDAISATATGTENAALGYNALKVVTSGARNAVVGSQAAKALITGIDNIALGYRALSTATSSESNTAIGSDALKVLGDSTNDRNTAVGTGSFSNLTTGQYNVAVGQGTFLNATSGSNNVGVGKYAGFRATNDAGVTSSNKSVFIGAETKPLNATSTNEIVIGYDARGLGNNSTVLGNSLITQAKVFGALDLPDATTSTSTTTGALKVGGGVGIVENLNVGGNAKITGTLTVTNGAGAGKVLTSDANGLGTWTTPTGVTTMAAIGSTPNANGATISGVNLNLEPASTSYGGIVTTGTQTFAGAKTFSPVLTAASGLATGTKFTPTLTAAADADILVGLDINPTFSNGSYAGLTNYALRVQGIGFGRGGGAIVSNTAIGSGTLLNNIIGTSNTGLGYQTLLLNTTGIDNTAFGANAGDKISSGSKNIFVGTFAGSKIASASLANSAGSNSVLIGYDVRPAADSQTNQIVISGYNGTSGTVGLGSNTTLIGSTKTQKSQLYGALTVVPNAATTSTDGNSSTIAAQDAGTGATNAGGSVNITAGNGNSTGLGGNIVLTPGTSSTAANNGIVQVNGQIKITGGSPAAGEVLVSDANGLATWSNALGSAVITTTASYAITLAESIVFYTGTSAGTFSIPAATAYAGKEITIKNKTAFGISITPASGTIYIDNANASAASVSIGIEASNNWIKLVSDGSQWNVLRALF